VHDPARISAGINTDVYGAFSCHFRRSLITREQVDTITASSPRPRQNESPCRPCCLTLMRCPLVSPSATRSTSRSVEAAGSLWTADARLAIALPPGSRTCA
jgi:hypothetical protein